MDGMGCGLGRSPWSACRVSPSSHAQALARRRRRCICSCDLDAACPAAACCSPRSSVLLFFTRETSYTGAQCTSRLYAAQIRFPPSPSPSSSPCRRRRCCCCCVSHAAISGSHSIRQPGKVKPSATCHRPPTPLFARFASLNLVAAVSTSSLPAAVRPFDPKPASTLYRQSLQEPAYFPAPAAALLPQNALPDPT